MAELLSLEQAWESLRLHLEWADAFWLVFVFTDDLRVARELGLRVQAEIESQGRSFIELRPGPDEDLRMGLAKAEERAIAWVDMVHHDARPELPVWRSSWERGLMQLNERREWLRRRWSGGGIVLATTHERHASTPALAPDLWSVRAMVLRVKGLGFELDVSPTPLLMRPPLFRQINSELQRQRIEQARINGDKFALAAGLALLAQVSEHEEGLALAKEGLTLASQLLELDDADRRNVLGSVFALLGVALRARGERELALEAHQRAADLHRALFHADPRYLPEMGSSLLSLSHALGETHAFELAREAAEQAVGVFRSLNSTTSEGGHFGVSLAGALNNLASAHSSLGRHAEALRAVREAIGLLRSWTRGDRGDRGEVQSMLAGSLLNLGVFSVRSGEVEEAISAQREALNLYSELLEAQPEVFAHAHADTLERLVTSLRGSGRFDQALDTLDDACVRYRRLIGEGPRVLAALSFALGARGRILLELGRARAANEDFVEALSHSPANPELLEGYERSRKALGIDDGGE